MNSKTSAWRLVSVSMSEADDGITALLRHKGAAWRLIHTCTQVSTFVHTTRTVDKRWLDKFILTAGSRSPPNRPAVDSLAAAGRWLRVWGFLNPCPPIPCDVPNLAL